MNRKIKLAYPTYRYNRQKKLVKFGGAAEHIAGIMLHQYDKANGLDISYKLDILQNPGPWTLQFDGKDFWFEGPDELIQASALWEEEQQ